MDGRILGLVVSRGRSLSVYEQRSPNLREISNVGMSIRCSSRLVFGSIASFCLLWRLYVVCGTGIAGAEAELHPVAVPSLFHPYVSFSIFPHAANVSGG